MAAPETPLVRSAQSVAAPCRPCAVQAATMGKVALVATTLGALSAGLLLGQVSRGSPPQAAPVPGVACALPPGVALELLAPAERALVARRALHCQDLVHGRIAVDAYRDAVATLDALSARAPAPPAPATVWSASVRSSSSQYSVGNWSAARALGAPDVFPGHGDHVNAWASLGADDRVEHLELGLARPVHVSAVEVFETFNPGAVSEIELVAASGARTVVHRGPAAPAGAAARVHRTEVACTAEPIVAVRITLDSPAVPGWNEIDAVGVVPCGE